MSTVGRVTFSTTILRILSSLKQAQLDYNESATPATTGKRVNKLSDDTSVTSRILVIRSEVARNDQYLKNISGAKLKLQSAEGSLSQMNDILVEIRNLSLRAIDPGNNATDLATISSRVSDLKAQLLSHANVQLDGKYIFSGTKTSTLPFSGTPTVYNGNSTIVKAQINSSVQVETNIDTNTYFMGNGGGQNIFGVIDSLVTDINAGNVANIQTDITNLDTGIDQIGQAWAKVSVSQQQLDLGEDELGQSNLQQLSHLSDLQDASIDQVLSKLAIKEQALKLVFSSSSRILSVTSGLKLDF